MQIEPGPLTRMLTRLKLTAVRDQFDSLLDEAGRWELSIRESLTLPRKPDAAVRARDCPPGQPAD
jgi:hypothetical protein